VPTPMNRHVNRPLDWIAQDTLGNVPTRAVATPSPGGPKPRPEMDTSDCPVVGMALDVLPPAETEITAGASYASDCADCALETPATVTVKKREPPIPATVTQSNTESEDVPVPEATEHDDAVYFAGFEVGP
jgi:hypothetical protein